MVGNGRRVKDLSSVVFSSTSTSLGFNSILFVKELTTKHGHVVWPIKWISQKVRFWLLSVYCRLPLFKRKSEMFPSPCIVTCKLTINRLFIWESDLNKTQKQRIPRPFGCTYEMSFTQTKQTIMAVCSGTKETNASKRVIRLNVHCGSPGLHRAFKTNSFRVSSRHQYWSWFAQWLFFVSLPALPIKVSSRPERNRLHREGEKGHSIYFWCSIGT